VQFERKELVVLIAGTLLAVGSSGAGDPCIFALCFTLSGLCFLYLCYAHKGSKRKRILTALFILLFFWFIGNKAYSSIVKSLSNQNFIPAERPRFSEKFDQLTFEVGGNTLTVPNVEGTRIALLKLSQFGKFELFSFGPATNAGGDTPLVASISNHQLYVDAEIFAGVGHPPMHFQNNEISNKPEGWDKNTDERTAIEVVNERKIPVLQIIYATDAHVVVKGVFINGDMVAIAGSGVWSGIKLNPAKARIRRLFKYPSSDYRGIFDYSILRCFDQFHIW
jgi:hypothetical protein